MPSYAIYLRKSRSDIIDPEHTLAVHEKALTDLAKRMQLPIGAIYREVVSGETIASRPVMLRLLSEVEQGLWDGVLVMEIERLARGDTIDQGVIAQTFKYSGTKIITPSKVYDPANEFDEEYFEFGLFMSRREYKTINRRQQRGRAAASQSGKWIANKPPYGWTRQKLEHEKGWILTPNPTEALIVRQIFDLYTNEHLGPSLIAHRLDKLKIPTPNGGAYWSQHTIRGILRNPAHIGMVRSGERPIVKTMQNGKLTTTRPHDKNCKLYKARWDGIISPEQFNLAQKLMTANTTGVKKNYALQNPLAGLVVCAKCRRKMVRRPYADQSNPDGLICNNSNCDNIAAPLYLVEQRVLSALAGWVNNYKISVNNTPPPAEDTQLKQQALAKTNAEIKTLSAQMDKLYDLLEQGIYTPEIFTSRSAHISERLQNAVNTKDTLEQGLLAAEKQQKALAEFIPRVENVLAAYSTAPTAQIKNNLLKEVIDHVDYEKSLRGDNQGRNVDSFEITLYTRLPE